MREAVRYWRDASFEEKDTNCKIAEEIPQLIIRGEPVVFFSTGYGFFGPKTGISGSNFFSVLLYLTDIGMLCVCVCVFQVSFGKVELVL